MQDDTNTTNTSMDQVAQEIVNQAPGYGLGDNPSGQSTLPPTSSAPVPDTPHLDSPAAPSFTPPAPSESADELAHPTEDTAAHASEPVISGDLLEIKQHALTELSPLVDKLDQPPEERYKTLMMLIQASDDQSLVKAAYEAAHQIEDETVRAEALLGIVNEINYFTQPKPHAG